jgi:hypothetical protein
MNVTANRAIPATYGTGRACSRVGIDPAGVRFVEPVIAAGLKHYRRDVAAAAVAHGSDLGTNNQTEFSRVPGLRVGGIVLSFSGFQNAACLHRLPA